MTSIPIGAQVSPEQLLHAVEQLPPQEFASFVARLLVLRAQRQEPQLSRSETELLLRINEGISAATQRRFEELVAKRQAEAITAEELEELKRITDLIERRDARRLTALDALVRLRRVSLADLMASLGIPPPGYA